MNPNLNEIPKFGASARTSSLKASVSFCIHRHERINPPLIIPPPRLPSSQHSTCPRPHSISMLLLTCSQLSSPLHDAFMPPPSKEPNHPSQSIPSKAPMPQPFSPPPPPTMPSSTKSKNHSLQFVKNSTRTQNSKVSSPILR